MALSMYLPIEMNLIAKPFYAGSLKGFGSWEAGEDGMVWFRVEFEIARGYAVGCKASILSVSPGGDKCASLNW